MMSGDRGQEWEEYRGFAMAPYGGEWAQKAFPTPAVWTRRLRTPAATVIDQPLQGGVAPNPQQFNGGQDA